MKKLLLFLIFAQCSWAEGPLYTYPGEPKLDQEINNIYNDIRTSKRTGILGTMSNDNAQSGYVGEYAESIVNNALINNSSGAYDDQTSISLTAGDWEITLMCRLNTNGATVTDFNVGVSSTSGNSSAGLFSGSNLYTVTTSVPNGQMAVISGFRMSLAATTTMYWKENLSYSAATPRMSGRLSARRMR